MSITFEDFMKDVHPANMADVEAIHEALTAHGCKTELKQAKMGYVLSYKDPATKKVLANYVFRKKGMFARIYGDNVNSYMEIFEDAPEEVVKAIGKASDCKRLLDPSACNSRCAMGYTVNIGDTTYKKCRYSGFMFLMDDDSAPFIKRFIESELNARVAG